MRRDPRAGDVRLRIDFAYDGGPFGGFARQPGRVTVQGSVEAALTRILGQPIATTGAGRTDRGVHADHQVVHLDVDATVRSAAARLADLDELRYRLGRVLAPAIAVAAVRRVPSSFDARFSATARRYRYRIADGRFLHPLRRFDHWHLGEPLNLTAMRRGAAPLVGEHDFTAFCRASGDRTLVRRVDRLSIARVQPEVVNLVFAGRAFCHQQVRAIVGCLVEVGRGLHEPEWVAAVLKARDRSLAATVAPSHGLTLEKVSYGRR